MATISPIPSQDTYLDAVSQDVIRGGNITLLLGALFVGGNKSGMGRPLLNFSLSAIPGGATISTAKLTIEVLAAVNSGSITGTVSRCTRPDEWVENATTWKVYNSQAVTSSSVANPSVITMAADHGFANGQTVNIVSHTGSTPDINGEHVISNVTADTFTIPVNVTVGGTGGFAMPSWTSAGRGGDFDDTGPPAKVDFTLPTSTGPFDITGLATMVQAAYDAGDEYSVIIRTDAEDPADSEFITWKSLEHGDDEPAVLEVVYTAPGGLTRNIRIF